MREFVPLPRSECQREPAERLIYLSGTEYESFDGVVARFVEAVIFVSSPQSRLIPWIPVCTGMTPKRIEFFAVSKRRLLRKCSKSCYLMTREDSSAGQN